MILRHHVVFFFFFNDTATTEIYTLSLHDALPIFHGPRLGPTPHSEIGAGTRSGKKPRSEEHTSELQSPCNLVCRLLLEKKKTTLRRSLRYLITCAHMLERAPFFTPFTLICRCALR